MGEGMIDIIKSYLLNNFNMVFTHYLSPILSPWNFSAKGIAVVLLEAFGRYLHVYLLFFLTVHLSDVQ